MVTMTTEELGIEREVAFLTRLGEMVGKGVPTLEQVELAGAEADQHIKDLQNGIWT